MKEIPKAITLWSTNGDHAAFMLLAPKSEKDGDCIFMLSPVSSKSIDSEMGVIVSELKVDGEQHFIMKNLNDGYELSVKPKSFPDIVFKLDKDFIGDVFTESNNEIKSIGTAEPAKKKA